MIFDLHVHTVRGGPDSNLSPLQLIQEAKRIGLNGACLTEHGGGWDKHTFREFSKQALDLGIVVIQALEVDTDMGHIAVFGLEGYVSGIHKAEILRKVCDSTGAIAIAVHPYRRFFDKPPLNKSLLFPHPIPFDETMKHPIFELVDVIEAVNGACSERENLAALETARTLGKPTTGGSDAHSTHGLGCGATVFEKQITSQDEFLVEVKAGRVYATNGLLNGHQVPFGVDEAGLFSR